MVESKRGYHLKKFGNHCYIQTNQQMAHNWLMHSIHWSSTVFPYMLKRRPAQEVLICCAGLYNIKNLRALHSQAAQTYCWQSMPYILVKLPVHWCWVVPHFYVTLKMAWVAICLLTARNFTFEGTLYGRK